MLKRKNYIHNNRPIFTPPKSEKKRPIFIYYALELAKKNDVTKNKLNYIIKPKNIKTGKIIVRHRQLNKHRACAMRAMTEAMIYHFNIASNLVYASIEQLSDECGLSTVSQSGNKSISRASRLISEFMEPMGFVKCKKRWDRILGTYMPKTIVLTPLFFELIGISNIKLQDAKNKQLNWINQNIEKRNNSFLSLDDISKKEKNFQIRRILSHQSSQYIFQKKKKYACKLFMLNEADIRQKIIKFLIDQYSKSELNKIGLAGFKKQVNIEYFYLKKLANSIYVKET